MVDGAHAFAHFDYKIPGPRLRLLRRVASTNGSAVRSAPASSMSAGQDSDALADLRRLADDRRRRHHEAESHRHAPGAHRPRHRRAPSRSTTRSASQRKEARLRYLQNYWTSKVRGDAERGDVHAGGPARSCAIANVGIEGMDRPISRRSLLDKDRIWTNGDRQRGRARRAGDAASCSFSRRSSTSSSQRSVAMHNKAHRTFRGSSAFDTPHKNAKGGAPQPNGANSRTARTAEERRQPKNADSRRTQTAEERRQPKNADSQRAQTEGATVGRRVLSSSFLPRARCRPFRSGLCRYDVWLFAAFGCSRSSAVRALRLFAPFGCSRPSAVRALRLFAPFGCSRPRLICEPSFPVSCPIAPSVVCADARPSS